MEAVRPLTLKALLTVIAAVYVPIIVSCAAMNDVVTWEIAFWAAIMPGMIASIFVEAITGLWFLMIWPTWLPATIGIIAGLAFVARQSAQRLRMVGYSVLIAESVLIFLLFARNR